MYDYHKTYDPLKNLKYSISAFVILVIITLIIRFYNLTVIPPALYQDETAIGYNAYLITEVGKDEYGNKFPLYFKSFRDYKLPAYIYTTALFIKLIGVNEYAVRLPSAIFGSIAVFIIFFIVRYLTKNSTLGFVAAFLLALNPWHIHFSRTGFEVNMALTFALLGVSLFIWGINKRNLILLLFSVLFFGISLYSYNVARLFMPLIVILLILLNKQKFLNLGKKTIIFISIFAFIIIFPFVKTLLTPSGIFSASSSLITSTDVVSRGVEFRSYLSTLPQ